MKTTADFIEALRPVSHGPKVAQDARRLAARDDAARTVDRLEALALRQQRQRWRSLATLCRLRRALYKVARCGTLAAPFVALLMLSGCSGNERTAGLTLLLALACAFFSFLAGCDWQAAKVPGWQAELVKYACAAVVLVLGTACAHSVAEQGLRGRAVDCRVSLGAMPVCALVSATPPALPVTEQPAPELPPAAPRVFADFVAASYTHADSLLLADMNGDLVARRVRHLEALAATLSQQKPSAQLRGLAMHGIAK